MQVLIFHTDRPLCYFYVGTYESENKQEKLKAIQQKTSTVLDENKLLFYTRENLQGIYLLKLFIQSSKQLNMQRIINLILLLILILIKLKFPDFWSLISWRFVCCV